LPSQVPARLAKGPHSLMKSFSCLVDTDTVVGGVRPSGRPGLS